MRRIVYLLLGAALAANLIGCNKEDTSTATADSRNKSYEPIKKPEPKAVISKVVIPSGTHFRVALIDAVSSDKSHPGDSFMASLAEPIAVDGKTVLEKGTIVHGRVVDAKG